MINIDYSDGKIKITITHLPQYKKGLYLFPDTEETINMFFGLRLKQILVTNILNQINCRKMILIDTAKRKKLNNDVNGCILFNENIMKKIIKF